MKLSDAREHYYTFTGKLSDVNRQLCFAGIAVVWIFVIKDSNGNFFLPQNLMFSLGCFVLGLTFDLTHYVVSSASWGIFHRIKEKKCIGEDADFLAPTWINYAPNIFFWLKVLSTLLGFATLIRILLS